MQLLSTPPKRPKESTSAYYTDFSDYTVSKIYQLFSWI